MANPVISAHTHAERTTNGTTLTCSVPTNANGDAIYYVWASDGDGDSASISGTGWTTLLSDYTLASSGVGDSGSCYIWKRTASSEPADYTVTAAVSERSGILAFTVQNDGGLNVSVSSNAGSNTTVVSNAITTSVANCLRVSIIADTGDHTPVGTLTNHTLVATYAGTSAATISLQYKALPTAVSDGTESATQTGSIWTCHTFAIAPTGGTTYNSSPSGSVTPTGAVVRQTVKKPAGSVTPTGAVIRQTVKKVAGSLTPSGALTTARVYLKSLAGSLTPAGALIRSTTKKVAGSLTPTGAAIKQAGKALAGSITPTGALSSQKITLYLKSVAGSLTPSGALVRRTNKVLAGSLTPVGSIVKAITKKLAGVLGLAGALVRAVFDFDQADVTLTDAAVTVCSLIDAAVTTVTLTEAAVTTLTITDAST